MTSFLGHDQHPPDTLVAIAAAYLLALPLGWERKAKGAAHVGLPLVSVGTCAYLLLSRYLHERGLFDADGVARSLRAMMPGIGFIGGGDVLKNTKHVLGVGGVTTATSVCTTGTIGASVAHSHYTLAAVTALTSLFVVEFPGWKAALGRAARRRREALTEDR